MASHPPLGHVEHLPAEDAYRISSLDMQILRDALHYKANNQDLQRELDRLRQQLERCQQEGT